MMCIRINETWFLLAFEFNHSNVAVQSQLLLDIGESTWECYYECLARRKASFGIQSSLDT